MLNTRNLLLTVGLTGAAVVAVLNVCANRLSSRDARLHRKALQRWRVKAATSLRRPCPSRTSCRRTQRLDDSRLRPCPTR